MKRPPEREAAGGPDEMMDDLKDDLYGCCFNVENTSAFSFLLFY